MMGLVGSANDSVNVCFGLEIIVLGKQSEDMATNTNKIKPIS